MILKRIHTGLILWAATCSCLLAATRYVSHSGSNTLPYTTWETAANTIEAANIATIPGDTMFIDTGSYYLSRTVYTQSNVIIHGKGMDSTTVLGADSIYMFEPNDSNLVEDISFVGHGSSYAFVKYINQPHRSFFCYRCKFSNFTSSILIFDDNREIQVQDCWFETWGDFALYLTGPGDYDIEHNTFYAPDAIKEFANFIGNYGTIILRKNIFVGGGFAGIQGGGGKLEARGNLFYHNTRIYTGQVTGAHQIVYAQNTVVLKLDEAHYPNNAFFGWGNGLERCQIYNNIFAGVRPRVLFVDSPPTHPSITIAYNCFYSTKPFRQEEFIAAEGWFGEPLAIDSIYGNVYADPMLVDDWNGDLRLQKGSPCIDAGAPWILDVDGTRSDIGAFGGPGGSFYVYQDLPPKMPVEMDAFWFGDRIVVSWERNSESDFTHYVLFRTTDPAVPLDSSNVLAYLDRLARPINVKPHKLPLGFKPGDKYYDPNAYIPLYDVDKLRLVYYVDLKPIDTMQSYYTLIAVDSSGLVSGASQVTIIPTGLLEGHSREGGNPDDNLTPHVGMTYDLEQNYPNPFNASTAIVYSLPNIGAQPAPVCLAVFNLLGQQIKSLIDEKQQPGRHTVYWDGTDQQGQPVASGVYFYRLEVSGVEFVKSGKMILMK